MLAMKGKGFQMKTIKYHLIITLGFVYLLLAAITPSSAQTSFSYKGSLVIGGVAVSGNYDFQFTLYTASSGGSVVGTILTRLNVPVSSGVYTVTLDFGSNTFTSPPLFLQIAYRKSGTTSAYTPISPRLQLSVRFSIVASSAMGLQGRAVSSSAPASGQVLKWNGTQWAPGTDANTTYAAGAGLSLSSGVFSIATGGVVTAMLANNAVTRAILADNTIITSKLVNSAVTSAKIAWPLAVSASSADPLLKVVNTGSGIGLYGQGGSYLGVYGTSDSSSGVYGSSGSGTGVTGYIRGGGGGTGVNGVGGDIGVHGSGRYGVFGESDSYLGVYGTCDSGTGVYGSSFSGTGVTGYNRGTGYGVRGIGGGIGVYGESAGYGVYGKGTGGYAGVFGFCDAGNGVYGESGYANGVYGKSGGGFGVVGVSALGYGVYGRSDSDYAGFFDSKIYAYELDAVVKHFLIDHPLDPANRYLVHSCVESNERANLYRGNVFLNESGDAWVEMPEWFEALNRDFTYHLTPIGAPGPNLYIAQKIAGNRFKIAGGRPGMEVSWQVTGVRQDAYANAHPMEVDQLKPEKERGLYLNPVEHGQPESLGIHYARRQRIETGQTAQKQTKHATQKR